MGWLAAVLKKPARIFEAPIKGVYKLERIAHRIGRELDPKKLGRKCCEFLTESGEKTGRLIRHPDAVISKIGREINALRTELDDAMKRGAWDEVKRLTREIASRLERFDGPRIVDDMF